MKANIIKETVETYGARELSKRLRVREQTVLRWQKGITKPNKQNFAKLNRLNQSWIKQVLHQCETKDLKVISLFSGCGGMDLGFEGNFDVLSETINPTVHPEWLPIENRKTWVRLPATRFKTIFANDISRAGKAAWVPYFENRGAEKNCYHLESIVTLVKKQKLEEFSFPNADIVTGGFPCQDFSVAGKRKGFNSSKAHHGKKFNPNDNPTKENRGKLYIWMRHVIEIVRPKIFIAENVKGLASLKNVKETIENDFRNIGSGYLVTPAKLLYAPDYGIPQTRERIIFIGFRKDALKLNALNALSEDPVPQEFDPYPQKTHCSPLLQGRLLPYVPVKHCFKGLLEPEYSLDSSQQTYSKAKWYGKHCQGQNEVDLNKPGPTIRSEHHGNIEFRRLAKNHGGKHFNELAKRQKERRLTLRECARIQTFPDEFQLVRNQDELGPEFKLSGSEAYKIIGNAVPPLLAMHLAWRLQELWPIIIREDLQ